MYWLLSASQGPVRAVQWEGHKAKAGLAGLRHCLGQSVQTPNIVCLSVCLAIATILSGYKAISSTIVCICTITAQ